MGEGESVTTESLEKDTSASGREEMGQSVVVVPFPHHEGRRQN